MKQKIMATVCWLGRDPCRWDHRKDEYALKQRKPP
jgi:hypothetical protein